MEIKKLHNMIGDIAEFHEKFGLAGSDHPALPDANLADFRIRFMQEELEEFKQALRKDDLVEAFDALIDLVYVVLGTAHMMGLPFQEGWDIVHEANMKKVRASGDGSDSKRGSAWDVVKPEGWEPPNGQLLTLINKKRGLPWWCRECQMTVEGAHANHVFSVPKLITEWPEVKKPSDVRHQNYYTGRTGVEVIDVIKEFELGFVDGNLIKYVLRCRKKGNQLQDLRKAQEYLDMLLSNAEKESKK
jgi:predicted HAD superfamily Cof-like phosphohydrolase